MLDVQKKVKIALFLYSVYIQTVDFRKSNFLLHWILQVTGILSWIVRSWTDVENNIVSVERVNEYADTPKEVTIPTTETHQSLLRTTNPKL